MTFNERISAFSKLGELFAHISDNSEPNSNKFSFLNDKIEIALNNAQAYNNWFTLDNIKFALKNWSTALNEENLNTWVENYPKNAIAKKVGIIMAGNIPLVGFHDLLAVLLTGNIALVKTSSKDNILIKFVIDCLLTFDKNFEEYIKIVDRLEGFDAVIATGSNNTARYFEQYFGNVPNIIRKNRTSVAVLNGNESELQLQKLGEDIFRYFGLGCRNVTKLYFKQEDQINSFFEAILPWGEVVINHPKYANNYDYNRAIYLLGKDEFLDNNFLLLKKDKNLHSPIAVINYEIYDDLNLVKDNLLENEENIQCVISLDLKDNPNYVDFGCSQTPTLTDYADNINTLEFLANLL